MDRVQSLPRHFRVETTSRPWFGPRARAKSVLAGNRTHVLPPDEAALAILGAVDTAQDGITGIRFIDFFHKSERYRYTIAVVWTQSDQLLRQAIYDGAEQIVRKTGWYPLVQGERLGSAAKRRESWRTLQTGTQLPQVSGDLLAVRALVAPEGGCSVWVSTSSGGIVLDTGFPEAIQPSDLETAQILALSHSHQDHAGGFLHGTGWEIPAICSLETAGLLFGNSDRNLLPPRLHPLDFHRPLRLGNIELELIPVPHLPGAAGIQLTTETATLLFTGDICLKSAHLDFIPVLADRLAAKRKQRTMVLLDATMAGRAGGASSDSVADDVIDLLDRESDIVLTAEGADHLLYAYLDLFKVVHKSARRGSINFIVSRSMRPLFNVIHDAYMHRAFERLDPYLYAHYGKTMSAWAESRWLYWSDGEALESPSAQTLWFFPHRQLSMLPRRCQLALNIGRPPRPEFTFRGVLASELDTSAWTLHSDQASIEEAAAQLSRLAKVVLFHNFPDRLRKFIARRTLSAVPLTGEAVPI